MKTPRLVATDLDGTLVGSDGDVSARNREAIRRVEAAGALFVMVTGRPPRWMHMVSEQTGHRGIAVCANGAVLYDLHTERVVRTHLLDRDVAVTAAAALREALPDAAFAVESADGRFAHESSYVPSWEQPDHRPRPVEDLVGGGVAKLLVRHRGMGSDALLATARSALGDSVTLTHSSNDGLVEISAVGISKASGLSALAREQGLEAAEVVAFGDMPNDLPMLAWAGHGVAVANAHPDVLAAADEVTGTNDEDGVAQVLDRWF